ncbi:MAG: peptide chain release factor N(5)-glutamine methyltransferase [Alphaproteobacteria bacterium]|nr:peptide chain release factor N(5)-glutamine methyltransferase [Alphaproteobacteria bacterium]
MSGGATVAELIDQATAELIAAGVEDARRDARLLMAAAMGVDQAALLARGDRAVAGDTARRFRDWIARRSRREPVARILARRGFWTLELALTPDTLDPRPDSETLVEAVLRHLGGRRDEGLRILDLGTGSGCLLLALLSELPHACGLGIDRAFGAAAAARANAVAAGLAARARFAVGDWTRPIGGRFDVVVANPPYIRRDALAGLMPEVARYDPVLALDGGPDGLDAYRAILSDLPRVLAPGAVVALEIGAGQGDAVATLLLQSHLLPKERRCDLAGVERCILATGG